MLATLLGVRQQDRRLLLGGQRSAGKRIRAGDKVVMWYISANRDDAHYTEPDRFDVSRREARHLAFGIGTHFCVGSRLAELQLRCLWEEVLARGMRLELLSEPQRLRSCVINGFVTFQVQIRH